MAAGPRPTGQRGSLGGGRPFTPPNGTFPDIREFGPWEGRDGGQLNDNREGETLEVATKQIQKEARGSRLLFPRGDARIFTPGPFKGLAALQLQGATGRDGFGGLGAVAGSAIAGTRIIYAGLGERAFDFRSGSWFTGAQNIAFIADNPAFAGTIVDISGSQLCDFEGCSILGSSTSGTLAECIGMLTANCNSSSIRRCKFVQTAFGITGRLEAGQFAIAMTIEDCIFSSNIVAHVLNPHEAWAFEKCIFEGRITNKGISNPVANSVTMTQPGEAVDFLSCWFGQTGANLGTHITWKGNGLRVIGGQMSEAAQLVELADAAKSKPKGVTIQPGTAAKAAVGLKGVASTEVVNPAEVPLYAPLHQIEVAVEKE